MLQNYGEILYMGLSKRFCTFSTKQKNSNRQNKHYLIPPIALIFFSASKHLVQHPCSALGPENLFPDGADGLQGLVVLIKIHEEVGLY